MVQTTRSTHLYFWGKQSKDWIPGMRRRRAARTFVGEMAWQLLWVYFESWPCHSNSQHSHIYDDSIVWTNGIYEPSQGTRKVNAGELRSVVPPPPTNTHTHTHNIHIHIHSQHTCTLSLVPRCSHL